MAPSTSALLVFLALTWVCPWTDAQQRACSFNGDGTPSGSGLCTCFESQDPRGWIVTCASSLGLTEVPIGIPTETVFLTLRGNSITNLTATSFQNLASLETLYLQENGLRSDWIAEGAFSPVQNLVTLDLSSNRIQLTEAMVSRLSPLTSLETLTLTNNNINNIDNSALTMFDRLQLLDLTSNSFVCDCDLSVFRNWLYNKPDIPRIMGATCATPTEYARQNITAAGFCRSDTCYRCSSGTSDEDCNSQGNSVKKCGSSQNACLNEIRVENGAYRISKQCQQLESCLTQVANNPSDCNSDTVNSVCRTCCQGDLCNGPASGVLENYTLPGFPPDPNTPSQTTTTTVPSSSVPARTPSESLTTRVTETATSGSSRTTSGPILVTNSSGPPVSSTSTSSPTSSSSPPGAKCPEEVVASVYGQVTWSETLGGEEAEAECPYGYAKEPRPATRRCLLESRNETRWAEPDMSSCASSAVALGRIMKMEITPDNAVDISMALSMLTNLPDQLTEEDVELAVDVLENLSRFVKGFVNDSTEVVINAMNTIDNLGDARTDVLVAGQRDMNTITRILHLVDQFALNVQFEGETFEVTTSNQDLAILKTIFPIVGGVSFRTSREMNATGKSELTVNATDLTLPPAVQASLELPESLFESRKDEIERVQFVAYKNPVFFEVITASIENATTVSPDAISTSNSDENEVDKEALNSLVISASVGDLKIENLTDPVKTSFVHQRPNADNPKCAYWDFSAAGGQGSWSTKGCRVSVTADNTTQCECDHLTNFAILMDIYGRTTSYNDSHLRALAIITYVGCTMSIIGLTLTFITYLMIRNVKKAANRKRQLRSDRRTRVLLNLVAALLLMNLVFLADAAISEFGHPGDVGCKVLGALLHYTLLTAVTWMALEAWHMYLALVIVFDSYTSHLMKKMAIIGWGFPVIVVGINVGIDLDHYDYYDNFCWLEVTSISFYVSFVGITLAVLLFNVIVFMLVTHQLCSLRRRSMSNAADQFDAIAQLRASLSITVLLGLTWGLAIFMIGEASLVFGYLFAIFNSLQGFAIFVFHCILNEEARVGWKKMLCPQCLTLEELAKGSSGQHFSSSNKAQLQKRTTLHVDFPLDSNGHQTEIHNGVPHYDPFEFRPESIYQESKSFQDSKI